ncbi:LL-diaminopimelate aminotransferase [Porphyromonadaceae bacterium W3.11]|nr:LL-diaminopimelate aminotransferase [Porphyromonadaceae bacterium W3.11]
MSKINDNFLKLPKSYLFAEINKRVAGFQAEHPDAKVIRMGIGDVTLGLPSAVIQAMHDAVDELSKGATLKGYGPEQGYAFLRESIVNHDYAPLGVMLEPDEVFVSDGAKSDTANITDLFGNDVKIAITDPVYPVYVDSNVLAGRGGLLKDNGRWSNFIYLPCNRENGFVPPLPEEHVDLIYLCYPNNPTGTTLTREELKQFVDYARSHQSLILFDAAYEAFVTEDDVPRSIYEIEGAKECAIEFRSYSKTAGFTSVRCGYTVVPKDLPVDYNAMWSRRQTTKFNGASYISQRGAAAIYTDLGRQQVVENIRYYLHNASVIREALSKAGVEYYGGVSSPYIWLKTPEEYPGSWDYFNYLLEEKQVVGTPGVGFGIEGEGYFRLSAFSTHEATLEAMSRIAAK